MTGHGSRAARPAVVDLVGAQSVAVLAQMHVKSIPGRVYKTAVRSLAVDTMGLPPGITSRRPVSFWARVEEIIFLSRKEIPIA